MLTRPGAKLMDFGLAKAMGPAPARPDLTLAPTMPSPLTAEGKIVGTFQCMAPEQLEGREADARCDLFAPGVVLYEMATERRGGIIRKVGGSKTSSETQPTFEIPAECLLAFRRRPVGAPVESRESSAAPSRGGGGSFSPSPRMFDQPVKRSAPTASKGALHTP